MKKSLGMGILMIAGLLFACAPAARAEYIISFGFSNTNKHVRDKKHEKNHLLHTNYGHYPHGYYYWPPKPYARIYTQTVIKTVEVQPKETTVSSSREKLGISDIIVLNKAGVSDDAIIDKIARTNSVFKLTAEEISALVKEGVSNRVINFMLNTTK